MKLYQGKRVDGVATVTVNGARMPLPPGKFFDWGKAGDGSVYLAYRILLDAIGPRTCDDGRKGIPAKAVEMFAETLNKTLDPTLPWHFDSMQVQQWAHNGLFFATLGC